VTQPVVQLNVGDTVPLGTILANIHMMGVVTDPSTPNMLGATLEVFGDQGVLTVPVLQGPPGPTGQPQFALAFQNDNLSSPSDLPSDLTDTDADIGKYWIFETVDNNGNVTGTSAYIWYGTEYRQMPMGSQGPPGPYPVITPTVSLLDSDLTSYITVSGPASNPQWLLNLAVPQGPPGPSAALASCPDVNMSTPPISGQVLGFNGNYTLGGAPIWQPMWVGDILPAPFTIPEGAFQSYTGITQGRQTVCAWQAPAQQWPWQPFVWGQLDITGVDISLSAGGLGAEVRINDPTTGPLIGVGTATSGIDTRVTIVPHTSSSGSTSTAMTPTNGYAQVAAGTSTTIYVNLVNNGFATLYDFAAAGSQLAMVAFPVGTERALPTSYFGTFTQRTSLSATWEITSGS
jgi:hypothetical protein